MSEKAIDYFNKIYDETFVKMLSFVSPRCINAEDVSDILQEVYAEFYKTVSKKGVDYADNPIALLTFMAKSQLTRYYKKHKKHKDIIISSIDYEEITFYALEKQSVEWQTIDKLMLSQVWDFVSQKDEEIYRIFTLRYLEDKSLQEIAEQMEIPLHTVRNRLYRTIEEVKEKFSVVNETNKERQGAYE